MQHAERINRDKILLWLALLALCAIGSSQARTCGEQAREIALRTVRESSQRGTSTFLRAHLREDIQELIGSLWHPAPGGPERDLFIFEVSSQGYELGEERVIYHLSVHGPLLYFVAVLPSLGETFRLAGFRDSHEEFNRLARSYGVKIQTELQAQEYARLYHLLNPRNRRFEMVDSPMQLKHAAENRFLAAYGDFTAAQEYFNKWWKRQGNRLTKVPLGEEVKKADDGFVVSFTSLSDIAPNARRKGPALLKVSIEISHDGQVKEAMVSILSP